MRKFLAKHCNPSPCSTCLASNSDVWGFDDAAVNALRDMKPVGMPDLVKKYAVLLHEDSELLVENGLSHTGMMDSQVLTTQRVICSVVHHQEVALIGEAIFLQCIVGRS